MSLLFTMHILVFPHHGGGHTQGIAHYAQVDSRHFVVGIEGVAVGHFSGCAVHVQGCAAEAVLGAIAVVALQQQAVVGEATKMV